VKGVLAGHPSTVMPRLRLGTRQEALSRALRLDDAERAHLFDLARAAGPVARRQHRRAPTRIRPVVQRVVDSIGAPAILRGPYGDYVGANQLGRALYAPLFDSLEQPANTPASPSLTRPPSSSIRLGSRSVNVYTAEPASKTDEALRLRGTWAATLAEELAGGTP
jgi:hypothetical protein